LTMAKKKNKAWYQQPLDTRKCEKRKSHEPASPDLTNLGSASMTLPVRRSIFSTRVSNLHWKGEKGKEERKRSKARGQLKLKTEDKKHREEQGRRTAM
jgi:hypothetical protein